MCFLVAEKSPGRLYLEAVGLATGAAESFGVSLKGRVSDCGIDQDTSCICEVWGRK